MGDIDRIDELFHEVSQMPEPERAPYLERVCGEDVALRDLVSAMLQFEESAPEFLEGSATIDALARSGRKELPSRLGGFLLGEKLGEGGMGTVYEAEQDRPRRQVALKILKPEFVTESSLHRFERESELLGKLGHPGIAQVYASGRDETPFGTSLSWFAMERVRGLALTQWADARGLDLHGRIELFARACDAVHHAHLQGVVHRDLKPSNILVTEAGDPKVLDFGIARLVGAVDTRASMRTASGEIMGTLTYMSPEQASGGPERVDPRSDVYSLGVVLFELLTGTLPYDITTSFLPEAVRIIREVDPLPASRLRPALRGDVEVILGQALEKDRERRYGSAMELADDLRRFLAEEPIRARPASRAYRMRKFVVRNRTLVGGVVSAFLALAIGLVLSIHFGLGEAEARRRTEEAMGDLLARSYQTGLLAAQGLHDAGNATDARAHLESLPEELRGWEWGALNRQVDPHIARFDVPGLEAATFVESGQMVALCEGGRAMAFDLVSEVEHESRLSASTGRVLSLNRLFAVYLEGDQLVRRSLEDPRAEARRDVPDVDEYGEPLRACLSEEGDLLAVAFPEEKVLLLRWESTRAPVLLEGAGQRGLALSGDARFLAGIGPKSLTLWDVEEGRSLWAQTFRPSRHGLHGVAFDPGGKRLACGVFKVLSLRGLDSGEEIRGFHSEIGDEVGGRVLDVAFGPQGDLVAVRLWAQDALVLETETGETVVRCELPRGNSRSRLAFDPEGTTLMAIEPVEETVSLFAIARGPSEVRHEEAAEQRSLAVSPDGALVATGGRSGTVHVLGVREGRETVSFDHPGEVHSQAFSPDGSKLAIGLLNRGFLVGDVRDGSVVTRIRSSAGSVAWSPDGGLLAIGSDHGRVSLLDTVSWEAKSELDLGGKRVNTLCWSPDGRYLARGTRKGHLGVIELETATLMAELKLGAGGFWEREGVQQIAVSPDGSMLAAALGNSTLCLYEFPELEAMSVFQGHQGGVHAVDWYPDGTRIATGGRDGLLRVWAPENGLLLSLRGHESGICDVAFGPVGRRAWTASRDGTLRVWDSIAPSDVFRLSGHGD